MTEMDNYEALRELEEQEDALNDMIRNFKREEEEEDHMLLDELNKLDQMYDMCDESDVKLKSLMEEKREILCQIRNENSNFADEFYAHVQNEQRKLEDKREELKAQFDESTEQDW